MPSLWILTISKATLDVFERECEEFFRGSVHVHGWALETGGRPPHPSGLVLLSSQALARILHERLKGSRLLAARRTIRVSQLDDLLTLPGGEPILVVNNAQDTGNDLVAQLRHLGFDHLELIPYSPGCSLSANDLASRVALTPGFPELVPAGIKRVIDVGVRSLDPSTLVELGLLLGRPLEDSHYYLSRKMSEVVGLAKKAIALADKARAANRKYEAVLSATDDGMLYVTAEGVVDSVNEPAANLFGKAPAEVLGKNVRELHRPSQNF